MAGCFPVPHHGVGFPEGAIHFVAPRLSALVEALDNGRVVRWTDQHREKRNKVDMIALQARLAPYAESHAPAPEPETVDVWVKVDRAVFCPDDASLLAALAQASAAESKRRELGRKGEAILDPQGERDFGARYAPAS